MGDIPIHGPLDRGILLIRERVSMMKQSIILVLSFLLLFMLIVPVDAVGDYRPLKLGDEIPLPDNIMFEVHEQCLEHDWFEQYHAREDGWYVVLSRVANKNGAAGQNFSRVYIDIYNSQGVFQKELSLNNLKTDIVALLTSTAVEIYTQNYYLSYNIQTEKLTCHYTPADYLRTSGIYKNVSNTKQQIGEWTYISKGFPRMYSTLTRVNGSESETLLNMKGSSLQFPNILPYIFCSAAVIVLFWYFVKKKRKK